MTPEELIENIDIGGPAMVRSAAKNFESVAVVTDPADYARVAQELKIGFTGIEPGNAAGSGAESVCAHGAL